MNFTALQVFISLKELKPLFLLSDVHTKRRIIKKKRTIMGPNFNKYFFLGLFFISLFSSNITAQCPTNSSIVFTSQNDVDEFKLNFPNCTDYEGDIRINVSSTSGHITSLQGLSNLERISGELQIIGNSSGASLTNFGGLQNLREVGSISLYRIYSLTQFGLEGLERVDEFYMGDMKNLTRITDETNFIIERNFILRQNTNLTNLGQINCAAQMDTINLFFNSRLTNFEAIAKVDTTKYLEMWQNYDLQEIASNDSIHVTDYLFYKDAIDIVNVTVDDELTLLRLEGNFGTSQFSEVREVTEELNLWGIRDLSNFNKIQNIGDLHLFNCGIDSGPEFLSLESIRNISLTKIQNMPELDFLEGVNFFGNDFRVSECDISHANQMVLHDSINYNITLSYLPNLDDIEVLTSIDTIRSLRLGHLPLLTDFTPLNKLVSASNLFLDNLDGLRNFEEFENLKELCTDYLDQVSISDNQNLENFDGLESLVSIGDTIGNEDWYSFNIRNNSKLESIYGLRNLVSLEPCYLNISGNSNLTGCSVEYVCNLIFLDQILNSFTYVGDNGLFCSSLEEIQFACGFNYIRVYFDENGNGMKDSEEHFVSIGSLNYDANTTLLPNNAGTIAFDLRFSNPSSVSYEAGANWAVTTNNETIDTTDPSSLPDYTEIGIKPTNEIIEVDMSLANGAPICDLNNYLRATFKNIGTTIIDVESKIEIPSELINAIPEPIESSNGIHDFYLTDVLPGQTVSIDLEMISPNVVNVTVGDSLDFKLSANFSAENLNLISDTIHREEVFLCAYDPNDKSVSPAGVQEENYTLFDTERFDYLIRFQNTGNFPATDITIRDTLSEHLDVSTFKFNDASHPVTQIKIERDAVRFYFKEINLIDSVANEALSHGYISYSIEPFQGLEEKTEIKNTAHIYFDSNPPIVTNTTLNTMVSEISGTSSVFNNLGEEKSIVNIYPNPVQDELNLKINIPNKNIYWSILDVNGLELMSGIDKRINIKNLNSGVYFLKIQDEVYRFVKTK